MTTEPTRTLTLATIKAKGACAEQVELFRRTFGKSVDVSESLAATHASEHASAFDWTWAAANLLSPSAWAACEAARAPARAAYDAARATAQAACEAARAPAWAAYAAATAPARAAYAAATAPARAAYEAARAPAWARAYINDEEQQPCN
jgi:hypothetical protein